MGGQQLPLAVMIMGPTASGKTDLALELARRFPCELISVDSALVYRGMDIGTAKPDARCLQEFPHHLIDILAPQDSYSAAQFRASALELMAAAVRRQRLPVLVGGTMLYYKALLEGLANMPESDPAVRAALEQQLQEQGLAAMHRQLQQVDARSAARIHVNDSQRILRALEVWRISGISMSEHRQRQQLSTLPYNVLAFAIAPASRQVLHERIAWRFGQMLQQGFVGEVEQLRSLPGMHADLPSMRAVGYRQVWDYLDGRHDAEQMYQRALAATRQLAKRQFTWLRSWPDLTWLDSLDNNRLELALKKLQQHRM